MTSTRLASITATVLISIAIACGDSNKATDAATGGSNGGTDALAANDAPTDGTGGSGSAVGVTCGSATCSATQVCCVGSGGSETCVDSGSCNGTSFSCTGSSSCGSGEACCYSPGTGTTCEMQSTCAIAACGSAADCSGNASMCCAVGSSSFHFCAAHCP